MWFQLTETTYVYYIILILNIYHRVAQKLQVEYYISFKTEKNEIIQEPEVLQGKNDIFNEGFVNCWYIDNCVVKYAIKKIFYHPR